MKSKARSIGMRLVKAWTRNTLGKVTLATLVIVIGVVGIWSHTIYAAKVRAEKAARQQAATLNQVMNKLNAMQSEMRRQSQTMEVRLEDLKQANAKLAAYVLRTAAQSNAREARVEQAVAFSPHPFQGNGIGQGLINTSPVDLEAKVCGNLEAKGDVNYGLGTEGQGFIEGSVGAEEGGNGVTAKAEFGGHETLEGSVSGGGDVSFEVCYAFSPTINFPTGIDTAALSSAVQASEQQVAAQIGTFLQNHPTLTNTALPDTIDAIDKFKANDTPDSALAAIQDQKQTLNNFAGMFQAVPLPGKTDTIVSDPSSFLPPASDLTPDALCSSPAALTSEFVSNLCNREVPPPLKSLNGVSTFLNTFTTLNLSDLQNKVKSVQDALVGVCSAFNGDVTLINSQPVTIPGRNLASFSFAGSTFNVNLPTISVNPFAAPNNLATFTCPSYPQ